MKTIFSGYLPQNAISEHVNNSIISFDTNAILNIYRFKSETSKEYLRVLEKIKDRVWLTYIVGLEYHSSRAIVLKQEREFLDKLSTRIDRFKTDITTELSNKEHNSFPFDEFNRKLENSVSELSRIVEGSKKNFPNLIKKDYIRDSIVAIFNGKTCPPPTKAQLESIYEIAKFRFEHKIPPGYKDTQNKNDIYKLYGDLIIESKYSDYIIWHELIEKAKETSKSIIFVTDEKKDDWILKVNGYVLGPRPELVTEMKVKAGIDFFMISSYEFISLIKSSLEIEISQSLVDDIKTSAQPSWKDIVVQAFKALGGTATLNDLYEWISKNPLRPLTANWKVTARKTVYYYCKDRDIFLGNEELFESLDSSTYRLTNY